MRNVRLLLTLAVAGCGLLVPAAAASAAATPPYPPTNPNLTVDVSAIGCNNGVTTRGTGFGPNEEVAIDVTTQASAAGTHRNAFVPVAFTLPGLAPLFTVRADGNGNFTTVVNLHASGIARITATGLSSGASASVRVVVLPPCGLPVTGNDSRYLGMALVGSAVAAAGVVLVVLARSRRRTAKTRS